MPSNMDPSTSTATATPSPGPLPTLEALRQFNRNTAIDTLLPPLEYTTYRQRLIFTDESLQTMLLRHVLNDAWKDVVSAKQKKGKSSTIVHWPRELCVVGSRVIASLTGPNVDEREEEQKDALSLEQSVDAVCYFVRPGDLDMIRIVAKKIKRFMALQARGDDHLMSRQRNGETSYRTRHNIIFVPYISAVAEAVLKQQNIQFSSPNNNQNGSFNNAVMAIEMPIDLVPLDEDVLSMELSATLRECFVDNVPTHTVQSVAGSLVRIQEAVGVIHNVEGLGPLAEQVIKKMMDYRMEDYENEMSAAYVEGGEDQIELNGNEYDKGEVSKSNVVESQIHAMLVLDRTIDLVTPMLTPLTYEGLLDDIIGIQNGHINVKGSLVEPDDGDPGVTSKPIATDNEANVTVALNCGDSLFAEVRGQSVEKIGSFLQDQAKALRESHANFTNRDKSLSEIHKFVKHIPIFTQNYRSLTQHINLAALVKRAVDELSFRQRWQIERDMLEGNTCYDELDELVYTEYPPYRYLKLLCLQSLTNGGIKSSKYESMKREIIQAYGYEFLFLLDKIEKLGALRSKAFMDSSSFSTLRKNLLLINEEVDTVEPNDIAYVSSGYAPLSIRFVQSAVRGWVGAEESLRELNCRLTDIVQTYPPEDFVDAASKGTARVIEPKGLGSDLSGGKKPILLVYFVGGVTFMEIHSLRFLSKLPKFPYQIICCTTEILNGEKLLRSLNDKPY